MEHIYFNAQLCINISNFKGISNIDILINLCLGTSLRLIALLLAISEVWHELVFMQAVNIFEGSRVSRAFQACAMHVKWHSRQQTHSRIHMEHRANAMWGLFTCLQNCLDLVTHLRLCCVRRLIREAETGGWADGGFETTGNVEQNLQSHISSFCGFFAF